MYNMELEPQPDYEVIQPSNQWQTRRVWMKVQDPPPKVYSDQELKNMPAIQNLLKKISAGEPHNAYLSIEGANFFPEGYESQNENSDDK